MIFFTSSGMGDGNSGFVRGSCEIQNCFIFTSQDNLWEESDAVVFHGEDLNGLQRIVELEKLSLIRKRRKQFGEKIPLFVYFMKEPPHYGNQLENMLFQVKPCDIRNRQVFL